MASDGESHFCLKSQTWNYIEYRFDLKQELLTLSLAIYITARLAGVRVTVLIVLNTHVISLKF
jgi:hypothetical protein